MWYEKYCQEVVREFKELVQELSGTACASKYAVLDRDGSIKHFKGTPGKGVRFKNCVQYFIQCKNKDERQAKGICATIARRKCKLGAKYACAY